MTVTAVRLGGRPDLPLLVLGPSLGTSATTLWSAAAQHLARDFQVVAWDLPGHGTNKIPLEDDETVSIASLAADVLEVVDSMVDGFAPGAVPLRRRLRSVARSASSCCSTRRTGWRARPCCAPARRSARRRAGRSASARCAGRAPPRW